MMRLGPLKRHAKNLKNAKFRVTAVLFPGGDIYMPNCHGRDRGGNIDQQHAYVTNTLCFIVITAKMFV